MMPRRILLGTGWKMTKTVREAVKYTQRFGALLETIPGLDRVQLFVLPAFTAIEAVTRAAGGRFWVGAQNMHWAKDGAFTGEISPLMLNEFGVELVELGHAERRMYFNETDDTVQQKVQSALEFDIRPLVCVGEKREERESGAGYEVVARQLRRAFSGTPAGRVDRLMVAYEPIWAIGQTKSAAPEDVRAMAAHIRRTLAELFGPAGESVRVLYGGTVNLENAVRLLLDGNTDGLFIGRAAWQPEGFAEIIRACAGVVSSGTGASAS
jgi:triosephosphate isomerase